jgi:hypothetical protein
MQVGAAFIGGAFLEDGLPAFADQDGKNGGLSKGDAALLRFAAAAEIRPIPPHCRFSTRTSHNIFTTTPMTRSLTSHF